jgi:HlyD family secretion protein
MKRWITISILLMVLFFGTAVNPSSPGIKTTTVTKAPFAVWSVYQGRLNARRSVMIMSRFRGNATVIELAPEGTRVSKGDVLVRFDSATLEREVLKLKRDCALAKSELDSLEHAELPLELRDIEMSLMEIRASLRAEQQYLKASIQLAKEGLVSDPEIKQQKLKVAEVKTQLETLAQKKQLTQKYIHPSALKRAHVKLASAQQELKLAEQQLQNSVVLAPSDGVVIYKTLPIATDFRTIRIGDSVYPNQPFMLLPDMDDLVVHCEVPEMEFARIQEGKDAFIQSLAYPGVKIPGTVESVDPIARSLPGQPAWQKFFHVVIGLKDVDSRLRLGMAVTTHILSYYNSNAVVIPRTAVKWEAGRAFAKLLSGSFQQTRQLTLGLGNEKHFEIIEGLTPGDEVIVN